MPTTPPPCPVCALENTYQDGELYICPDCAHEWPATAAAEAVEAAPVYKDAVGNVLVDGDSVTLIKDLKVKGSSLVIKQGTRIKNIRLVAGDHDVDCKVDGTPMMLKSQYLKKA
ncbi:MAG: zinc ribbon domain-containing protein YjdM [Stagnimonas sp.]|nr:zinc ribbon domain-containing protein YjdM [Stagnimonas sp.]